MTNSEWTDGFRSRLSLLLERDGHSKAEMARKCGIPPRTLENYFKGHKPGVEALIAISRGMGVDVDWLLGEKPEEKNMRTDLIGEAAWSVLHQFFQGQASEREVEGLRNAGRDPGNLAALLEARIVAQYLSLERQYAAPTLADAKTIAEEETKATQ